MIIITIIIVFGYCCIGFGVEGWRSLGIGCLLDFRWGRWRRIWILLCLRLGLGWWCFCLFGGNFCDGHWGWLGTFFGWGTLGLYCLSSGLYQLVLFKELILFLEIEKNLLEWIIYIFIGWYYQNNLIYNLY